MLNNEEKIIQLVEDGKIEEAQQMKRKIMWGELSEKYLLSEPFMRLFQDNLKWGTLSSSQILSEDFIKEFKFKFHWSNISIYQNLNEDFIRKFQDLIYWVYISKFQILSEDFIREMKKQVNWEFISIYQTLSEPFIREFKRKLNIKEIAKHQKLSKEIMKDLKMKQPKNNWLYVTPKEKIEEIKKNKSFEVIDDNYVIAYKVVRHDYSSVFKSGLFYKVGETCEFKCDYNINTTHSYGINSYTEEMAWLHCDGDFGKVLKVKIPIESIGAVFEDEKMIRSEKMIILEEIQKEIL